jgi:hypothetical protein
MGAKYSYRVCERFAHQAKTILRTFKITQKSRNERKFSKSVDLGPYVINRGVLTGGGG